MTAEFDKLKAAVAAEDQAITSAVTLLTNLGALIRQKADDPAALIELAAHIETQSQAIAAAVVANTPAEAEVTAGNSQGGAPATETLPVDDAHYGEGANLPAAGSEQSPNGGPGATSLDGQPLDTDNPTAGADANQSPVAGEEIDATKIEPENPAPAERVGG